MVRVFPRRTSLTPTDPLAFVGDPPLWRPDADEVRVSCTFTWDKPEAERLAGAWAHYYPKVTLGGPAYDAEPCDFVPGMYVREGVTFTTRGCNNNCPWCLVPKREGRLKLLPVQPGYIVNDNNLLQAPREHVRTVLAMLRAQRKAATFSGGLEAARITDWFADELRSVRVDQLFLAADTDAHLPVLAKALERLMFLPRGKKRVFCLLAHDGETIAQAETRLECVWALGGMPFAQLYQPADHWIDYSPEWRALARKWSRPAAMKATHGKGERP